MSEITNHDPADEIKEILADVWNRCISADEGYDKIDDALRAAVEADRRAQMHNNAGCESQSAESDRQASRTVQEDTERTKWLAALFPEDRMFEEIAAMARESYRHHMSIKRGQQIVLADNQDAHIIWATKRWIEENEPKVQPTSRTVPSDDVLRAIGATVGLGPSISVEYGRALLERYGQSAASAEPASAVNRETVIEWLDALDIEVTDKQLDGLFHAVHFAAPTASAEPCKTCGGSGWIGGPSYYDPGEGGEPCSDCAAPVTQEPVIKEETSHEN